MCPEVIRSTEFSLGRETEYARRVDRDSGERGGNFLAENESTSPDQLTDALRRYLENSGETDRSVASRIGFNYYTLRRWLSDTNSVQF
jgi:hypothetical protein